MKKLSVPANERTYADLPEEEKELDRKEADMMIAIFADMQPKASGDTTED